VDSTLFCRLSVYCQLELGRLLDRDSAILALDKAMPPQLINKVVVMRDIASVAGADPKPIDPTLFLCAKRGANHSPPDLFIIGVAPIDYSPIA
jgi:hypothetical protein